MRQMMNMNLDSQQQQQRGNESVMYNEPIFRTDSPAAFPQTDSPAQYAMDLPMHYAEGGNGAAAFGQHAATAPVHYAGGGGGGMPTHQYPGLQHEGYYPHSQHITL